MGTLEQKDTAPVAQESNQAQLVVFTLAGCLFGLGIRQVREIIRLTDITLMPKAPKFLEGIIHLRGRIIPVIDMKKRFGMPLLESTSESRILVVEWKEQLLGLLVDRVFEVGKVNRDAFAGLAEPVLDIDAANLSGTVQWKSQLVLLLNLEKIFGVEDWKALPESETTSRED